MNQIMKTVKSLKEAGLLINCVAQTIKNEVKEQKRVFPGMILGTLGASFLGNLLTGKKSDSNVSRTQLEEVQLDR